MMHTSYVTIVYLAVAWVTFTPVTSLKCNEGFNFTVGGIPFYYWTEQQCDANSNCVMQEYIYNTGKAYSEIAFRFGGCVSTHAIEYFKCQSTGDQPIKYSMSVAKDFIRALDRKLDGFAVRILTDNTHFWKNYLSRGKDFSEFLDGITEFLASVGYDQRKFRDPLHEFSNALTAGEYSFALMRGYSLLLSLKSEDPASKRLSITLREYIKQFYNGREPSTMAKLIVDSLPKVMYPVLKNTFPNLEHLYDDMSENLQLGFGEIAEENFSNLLIMITAIQSLITEITPPDNSHPTSEAYRKIVTNHMPQSSGADMKASVLNGLDSFLKEVSVECAYHDATCFQGRLQAHLQFLSIPFEYQRKISAIVATPTNRLVESLNRLLFAYVNALGEAMGPSTLGSKHSELIIPKIEAHLQEVINILNDPNEKSRGWFCQDNHCKSDLCNSHHYLIRVEKPGRANKIEL